MGYAPGDVRDFNPRSPCGERPLLVPDTFSMVKFQSTLPLRGATRGVTVIGCASGYFNPRSPCGERRVPAPTPSRCRYFNPRSPCGERLILKILSGWRFVFQSTLPLRGATDRSSSAAPCTCHFNPRSPCGERLAGQPAQRRCRRISIHAPLAGSDAWLRRSLR